MLDALDQRIADLLEKQGVQPNIIELYLDEIFAYSDRALYEKADDQTIISDFEDWLEN
jgi:hypothetical protein